MYGVFSVLRPGWNCKVTFNSVMRFIKLLFSYYNYILINQIRDEYAKLKKERDYHKINHLRLEQEKARLIANLKWTKNHYQSYPPALE